MMCMDWKFSKNVMNFVENVLNMVENDTSNGYNVDRFGDKMKLCMKEVRWKSWYRDRMWIKVGCELMNVAEIMVGWKQMRVTKTMVGKSWSKLS